MLVQRINLSDDQLKKCAYIFIAALLSYIAVFGFELTHFTLSIDEESQNNFKQTLSLGRWGHALLRQYLLPEPFVPFFTLMLAIIVLSLSSLLACIFLDLTLSQSICFVLMLAAIPQVSYQMEFSNQAETVAISMLCSTLSLFQIKRLSIKNALLFIVLTVISLSIYQSIFLYALSLLLIWFALNAIRDTLSLIVALKTAILFTVLVSISLVINAYSSLAVANHFNVEISSYLGDRMGWMLAPPQQILINMYNLVRDYLTFNAEYGLNSFACISVFFLLCILGLYRVKKNKLLVVLSMIGLIISAFLLNFAIGMRLPPRTMTQLPVVFAGIFIISVAIWRLKTTPILLSLVFLAVGTASSNSLFYSDYMAREADKNFSQRFIQLINQKYPSVDLEKTPIFFYGSYTPYNQWVIPNSDVFGRSFFSQDKGNNLRMYRYLSMSNIIKVKEPGPEQVAMARVAGSEMPSWPNKDSVSLVDGVVIVKLSNNLSKYNR